LQITGSIDRQDDERIEGWITVVGEPERKLILDVMLDGERIGQCVADRLREDLRDAGIGDGACAFLFEVPLRVAEASARRLRLRLVNSIVYVDTDRVPA
jgi:hypothetical protein